MTTETAEEEFRVTNEARRRQLQLAITTQHEILEALDNAKVEISDLRLRLRSADLEIEHRTRRENEYEAEIKTANMMRDQAIAERARLEALLEHIRIFIDSEPRPAPVRAPPTPSEEEEIAPQKVEEEEG